jgi:hypothetical protein
LLDLLTWYQVRQRQTWSSSCNHLALDQTCGLTNGNGGFIQ